MEGEVLFPEESLLVTHQSLSTTDMQRWAVQLRDFGLTDFAIPFLDVLQVWGFVGAQAMWMLTPLLGTRLTRFAAALEQPETLQQLQQYLLDGNIE